jgi:hypothetical protein
MQAATHDDTASGEGKLFSYLALDIPTGLREGRVNELGADISLTEGLLIHSRTCSSGGWGIESSSLRYSADLSILC